MNGREQRGMELAATARITRNGNAWEVPSQTLNGRYTVRREDGEFRCSCPDHELRGVKCKHAFAVEFVMKRETAPDGTVTEIRSVRVSYSQDWRAYNTAQTTEKESFVRLLHDLVAAEPGPPRRRGRPPLPVADKLFAATFKVYSTVSGRRFMTDLRAAARDGFISRAPHYNSIFNCIDDAGLTPVIQRLITRSAMPLQALETDFAVDSTGFGTQNFYRHYSAKYGHDQDSRDYVKMHAMVGVKTNVVTAAEITDRDTHDGPMMPGLVRTTAEHFQIEHVSADKAYSSRQNLATVDSLGAVPLVPFKLNARGDGDSTIWNRLYHFFHLHRDEFLPMYHTRSNVESTFSAIKRNFGDTIRSKTSVAQTNEALLKVLCHNIVCVIHEIHESGVEAEFPILGGCPQIKMAAQELSAI